VQSVKWATEHPHYHAISRSPSVGWGCSECHEPTLQRTKMLMICSHGLGGGEQTSLAISTAYTTISSYNLNMKQHIPLYNDCWYSLEAHNLYPYIHKNLKCQ